MKKQKISQEGLTAKKDENFSEWYTQVILKSELADYSKVSGSIVLRPSSYFIWEKVQETMNKKIKSMGVKNAYFPLLIPESLLNKEKEHVEGFNPEVAWVTHAGNTKLNEKLAIRPTSETIMYDSYKKWIRSHNDLPLRLNQWCSVLRWEFKHPMPFLRTREFLWQEGHTVFATKYEAEKEVKQILNLYANIYENLLAIPVLKGKKSEKEKFAGADYTLSIESFLPSGKGIQCATSHLLGQNFAKAFGITFTNKQGKKEHAWQNSWGLSTRSIGIMIAMHSDNKGLVLPPKVAENKIVIVPIIFKDDEGQVLKKAKELQKKLSKYSPIIDDRENYSVGKKFNEWELKGIPIRIEIGPKDIQNKQVMIKRRDLEEKKKTKITSLKKQIDLELEDMQKSLLEKARKFLEKSIVQSKNLKDTIQNIKKGKIVLVPLKGSKQTEDMLKHKTDGAKTLNIPFKQPSLNNIKCIVSGDQADYWVYVGKSY